MSYMALEVAPFCTRVLAPFYLRVSKGSLIMKENRLNEVIKTIILIRRLAVNGRRFISDGAFNKLGNSRRDAAI